MNIEAIVIRKVPIREHDQLVVLYSRELGKCSAIAKGSLRPHSKQALAIDEGNIIRCELVDGRAGPIMTGAQAVRAHAAAKRSLIRWAAVQFFLQVVDAMVYDAEPDEALWVCVRNAVSELDAVDDARAVRTFRDHQRKLLAALGYGTHPEAELDGAFEQIAQRRFPSLTLFYDMVRRPIS